MKRIFLLTAIAATLISACDSTDTTGPTNWTSDDLAIVGTDECGFFTPGEELRAVITVVGSTVTMVVQSVANPEAEFELTTDSYDPMDNEVLVTGLSVNTDFDPCVVQLDDAMRLTLADPDLSLEEQDSLAVVWNHAEEDISSAYDNACSLDENGDPLVDENDDPIILWFNELPCSGQANLTLTLEQAGQ